MIFKSGWATVLMTTRNHACFLERSIGSCFSQEHSEIEVLVVDDASEDDTWYVLNALQKKWGAKRLKIFRNDRNLGVCSSLNRVLKERTGEYFQFLDSDDYLHPSKIKKQVEALESSGAEAAICGFRFVNNATGEILREDSNDEDIKARLASFRGINTAVPLMRSDSVPASLCFDPQFRFFTDRDFFFRYFLTVHTWVHCKGIFVDYYQHDRMVTRQRKETEVLYGSYWKSASRYELLNRKIISRENKWMFGRYAASLAAKSYKYGQFASARLLVYEAIRGGAISPLVVEIGLKLMLPDAAIRSLRRLRRAIGGGVV